MLKSDVAALSIFASLGLAFFHLGAWFFSNSLITTQQSFRFGFGTDFPKDHVFRAKIHKNSASLLVELKDLQPFVKTMRRSIKERLR
jgi:hypothetical protein